MSNGTAPSCPISHSQPTQTIRQLPVAEIPYIPPAHNLRTVINAINIMNNVVQHVTRGQPQINNVYPTGEAVEDVAPVQPPPPPQYANLNWRETSRGYTQQQVINPDDVNQKIPIRTLTHVSWLETVIGHTFNYRA